MTDQRWDRLPCGREKEHLLALLADDASVAPGSHESSCPSCQAALEELAILWAAVEQWRTEPVRVPAGLMHTVIVRVRRMAQSPHHVVASAATGVTTVTSWVIGLLASEAAEGVTGIAGVGPHLGPASRSGRRATVRQGADAIDVTEIGAAAVALEFEVTAYPVGDLVRLADAVRREVTAEVLRCAELEVAQVDLTIGDLHLDA